MAVCEYGCGLPRLWNSHSLFVSVTFKNICGLFPQVGILRFQNPMGFSLNSFCLYYTVNDGYSGDRYSGNDGYSGLNPPDDAILFTFSGITAIADKKLKILYQNLQSSEFRLSLMQKKRHSSREKGNSLCILRACYMMDRRSFYIKISNLPTII